MKDLLRFKPKIDRYALLSTVVTFIFLWFTFAFFPGAFGRIAEAVKDLALSLGFYLQKFFHLDFGIVPTVSVMPDVSGGNPLPALPVSIDAFAVKMRMFGNSLITLENFASYGSAILHGIAFAAVWIFMLLPVAVGIYFVAKKSIYKQKADRCADTKPLAVWRKISAATYLPIRNFVAGYVGYLRARRWIWELWLLIWAFNFNLLTVAVEAFAFLFYLVPTFDFVNLYVQVYKLGLDLSGMFAFVPWWCWVVAGYLVFHCLRRKRGFKRLQHMERCDRGYINSLPVVTMICGSMGVGKNVLEVDMALSQTAMFRDKAYELILEKDVMFPFFPWLALEKELRRAMAFHAVWNLASCRRWIRKKHARFVKSPAIEKCFGYDYSTYGNTYCDNLRVNRLWNVLESYSQLYFVYVIETSLLVSNYAVREDAVMCDLGNFPRWDSDFFRRDARLLKAYSRHSHILDYDVIRLGRKVLKNNPLEGSLEFGVLLLSEIGKERGNAPELKDVKQSDAKANQKNDRMNWWLKMCRHAATIDYYPFVKVFTDEQRPESWGADARDLCQIVTIKEKGEERLAMPCFWLENLLHDLLFSRFWNMYGNYRYERGDNSLFMHAVKTLVTTFERWYARTYNQFGFRVLSLQTELGTQDGERREDRYYIMTKKAYADRYATDCFGDYFAEKALKTRFGLADYPEFGSIRATWDEMSSEHGYFFGELSRLARGEPEEDAEQQGNAEKETKPAPGKRRRREAG